MRIINRLIFLLLISIIQLPLKAQQVNTLYFMEDVPVRHYLNPSFQPTNDFYLSLPIIGFTQLGIGNNSLTIKDILYKVNGQTITFLNPQGDINRFYRTLKSNTVIRADLETNLLSVGFRKDNVYWTFSLSEKMDGMLGLPKDVFKLTLFGTPNKFETNSFNLTTFQTDVSLYSEAALGYSRRINNKWTLGGKVKFLYGSANFSVTNNQIKLEAGIDKWVLDANGSANLSSPIRLITDTNFQSFSYKTPTTVAGWLKPSGLGTGIDVGAEYELNNKFKFSAAIIDLGFIVWTKNVLNYQYGMDYFFNGIKQFDNTTTINTFRDVYDLMNSSTLVDSLAKVLQSSKIAKLTSNTYITGTTAKLNLGMEYSLLEDKLSIGLLSHTQFFKKTVTEEITTSVNARPSQWLDVSLSYSLLNGRFNTIGAGFGLQTGFIHWFFAADYLSFQNVNVTLSDVGIAHLNNSISIPYNSNRLNAAVGVNLVLDSHVNKMRRKKIEIAKRLGLRNTYKKLTNKTAIILPGKNKIFNTTTQKTSDGLNTKKSNQDCHCNWN